MQRFVTSGPVVSDLFINSCESKGEKNSQFPQSLCYDKLKLNRFGFN